MLGRPRGSVGMRGSMLVASADSDIFDFVTDVLAIEKSDFNTGSFARGDRLSASRRGSTSSATMRLNGMNHASRLSRLARTIAALPIQQTTELKQMNLTVSAKFAVLPRGRADQPPGLDPAHVRAVCRRRRRLRPLQVPAERRLRRLRQRQSRLQRHASRRRGWAPTSHVLGGTDIQVYRHLMLSLEGRYSWQHATLDQDFIDFEPIDLGGFRFGAGIHFAF